MTTPLFPPRPTYYFNRKAVDIPVYAKPTTDSTKVGKIERYCYFTGSKPSQHNDAVWVQVASKDDTNDGWVLMDRECAASKPPISEQAFYFSLCELQVREYPSSYSKALRTIKRNTIFISEERSIHDQRMWIRCADSTNEDEWVAGRDEDGRVMVRQVDSPGFCAGRMYYRNLNRPYLPIREEPSLDARTVGRMLTFQLGKAAHRVLNKEGQMWICLENFEGLSEAWAIEWNVVNGGRLLERAIEFGPEDDSAEERESAKTKAEEEAAIKITKEALTDFYVKHDTSRAQESNIDELLVDYTGRHALLRAGLRRKYNDEPARNGERKLGKGQKRITLTHAQRVRRRRRQCRSSSTDSSKPPVRAPFFYRNVYPKCALSARATPTLLAKEVGKVAVGRVFRADDRIVNEDKQLWVMVADGTIKVTGGTLSGGAAKSSGAQPDGAGNRVRTDSSVSDSDSGGNRARAGSASESMASLMSGGLSSLGSMSSSEGLTNAWSAGLSEMTTLSSSLGDKISDSLAESTGTASIIVSLAMQQAGGSGTTGGVPQDDGMGQAAVMQGGAAGAMPGESFVDVEGEGPWVIERNAADGELILQEVEPPDVELGPAADIRELMDELYPPLLMPHPTPLLKGSHAPVVGSMAGVSDATGKKGKRGRKARARARARARAKARGGSLCCVLRCYRCVWAQGGLSVRDLPQYGGGSRERSTMAEGQVFWSRRRVLTAKGELWIELVGEAAEDGKRAVARAADTLELEQQLGAEAAGAEAAGHAGAESGQVVEAHDDGEGDEGDEREVSSDGDSGDEDDEDEDGSMEESGGYVPECLDGLTSTVVEIPEVTYPPHWGCGADLSAYMAMRAQARAEEEKEQEAQSQGVLDIEDAEEKLFLGSTNRSSKGEVGSVNGNGLAHVLGDEDVVSDESNLVALPAPPLIPPPRDGADSDLGSNGISNGSSMNGVAVNGQGVDDVGQQKRLEQAEAARQLLEIGSMSEQITEERERREKAEEQLQARKKVEAEAAQQKKKAAEAGLNFLEMQYEQDQEERKRRLRQQQGDEDDNNDDSSGLLNSASGGAFVIAPYFSPDDGKSVCHFKA
jgi:hypothetical protein